MKNELDKYLEIVQDFVNRELPVEEFERNYLKIVKNDQYLFPDYVHKIIGTLFSDVDQYCGNPNIANYNNADPLADIDEIELRKRASKALMKLKIVIKKNV